MSNKTMSRGWINQRFATPRLPALITVVPTDLQTENGWHLEELTPQSNQQEPYDAVEAADASADA